MEAIIASVISSGLSLLGVVLTVAASRRKTEESLKTEIAVVRSDVQHLCKEVEKHNNFATRIPALEALQRENHDHITRLESFHME